MTEHESELRRQMAYIHEQHKARVRDLTENLAYAGYVSWIGLVTSVLALTMASAIVAGWFGLIGLESRYETMLIAVTGTLFAESWLSHLLRRKLKAARDES